MIKNKYAHEFQSAQLFFFFFFYSFLSPLFLSLPLFLFSFSHTQHTTLVKPSSEYSFHLTSIQQFLLFYFFSLIFGYLYFIFDCSLRYAPKYPISLA